MRPTRSVLSLTELSAPVPDVMRAGIDAHEGDRADERIVHDLEGQTGERRLVVGGTLDFLALAGSMPLTGGMSSGDGR